MRTKPLLVALSVLIYTTGIRAQTKIPAFGDISNDEMNFKECSFEKDAPAMYLLNQETITFKEDDYSAKTIYQRRVRIKIFNKSGFDFANVFIKDAKARYTKVDDLDAFVYNLSPDGKIISKAVDKDQIFKEKDEGNKKSTNLRFTFPDLKPGSVIEFRYTKTVKNSFGFDTWLLQTQIPVLVSQLTVAAPPEVRVNAHIVAPQLNDTDAIVSSSDSTKKSISKTYLLENIPSFKIEPYMSSVVDNLERIEFSVSPQSFLATLFDNEEKWHLISSFLMSSPLFGRKFDEPITGLDSKIDSIKSLDSDENKLAAVYNLVTKNVKWNNEQVCFIEDLQNAWDSRSGSSAEINGLLLNALKKAGLECYPVLISTRDNGKIDMDFPNIGQFNGLDVLAYINGKSYVIDGTQQYMSYLIPPLNTVNRNAFLLTSPSTWINISDDKPYMNSSTYVYADLDSTGMLKGEATITMQDYAKAEELEEDKKDETEKKEEAKNFLRYDDDGIVVDSIIKNDSADLLKPLVLKIKFHYALSNSNEFYFLNPFFFSMFRKNPFADNERYSDIDLGCMQHFLTYIIINLPENFSVEDSMRNAVLRTADTSLSFTKNVMFTNNQIGIKYVVDINNPFFDRNNYPGVKQFFDKIYGYFGQQILLKKKPE